MPLHTNDIWQALPSSNTPSLAEASVVAKQRRAAFEASPEGQRRAALAKEAAKLAAEKAAADKLAAEKAAAERAAAEKAAALKAAAERAAAEKVAEERAAAEQTPEAKARREQLIKAQFSLWNGSHIKLTQAIKTSMNDPSSYEHVETTYIDPPGERLVVTTTFRGKNAFGGVVLNTITAIVDMSGNVLDMRNR